MTVVTAEMEFYEDDAEVSIENLMAIEWEAYAKKMDLLAHLKTGPLMRMHRNLTLKQDTFHAAMVSYALKHGRVCATKGCCLDAAYNGHAGMHRSLQGDLFLFG